MPIHFTEANYKSAIIELLTGTLGYTHVYGPNVPRDYHSPLYKAILTPALSRLNPALPAEALY